MSSDHSTHSTVVEYAVRFLFKRKSPKVAAKLTAQKLSGGTNMFIGGAAETVVVDPEKLESAIWDRLVSKALKNIATFKAGKEDYAVGAVVDYFNLGKRDAANLGKLVVKKLGRPLRNEQVWTKSAQLLERVLDELDGD